MSQGLLQDYLLASVERAAGAVALAGTGEPMTYADLTHLSARIAAGLVERGLEPGHRVCLLLPKSPVAVAAILGVLRAGGVYVPLDPGSPAPRLARMVESCDNRWLLTAPGQASLTAELLGGDSANPEWVVGWLEAGAEPGDVSPSVHFTLDDLPEQAGYVDRRVGEDDPAYIMFTSGSTGIPKGVVITHRNVRVFVDWAVEYFELGPNDRLSGHPPLHFDLSVFDIFGALASGAALYMLPPEVNIMAPALARFIRDNELTQWFSVPSVLNYLVKTGAVREGDFPSLKRLLWCGEVLPTPTLTHLMRRLPHVAFTNLYGPTESTIASSVHTVGEIPADDADVPIGVPCGGEDLHVLDKELKPVPAGEQGCLFISGAGLSPGYWRDAEKTAAAFLDPAPELGLPPRIYSTGDVAWWDERRLLRYVGRADRQIKSRGYRIELGEIESALQTVPYLEEVSVVAIPSSGFEGMQICCAHTPDEVDLVQLRADLRTRLPAYMIPTAFLGYPQLPTNSNGKVDRKLLAAAFEAVREANS